MDLARKVAADAEPGAQGPFPTSFRVVIPYLVSLLSLVFPALITVALQRQPHLRPFISFAFALDVAAVAWLAGFWAGALVSLAATPMIMFVVSHGRSFIPQRFDFAALSVMLLISVLASRMAAARERVESLLRSANRELDDRVQERTLELERARESLQITLASIGDAVMATDTGGRVTVMNGVAESLTGWPAREALGHQLDEIFVIVNADTRETVESPVAKVLRLGTSIGLANHTLLLGRHGREIPIDDSGAPIRTADGGIAGVVLTFRDISERYRAESERQKLLEADERLVGILTNINEGFLVVDGQWRLTYLNRKASELVRKSVDELLTTNLWESFPALIGTPAEEELQRAMRDDVPVRCLFHYEPLRAWFDFGAYPSGDGRALLLRDITDHQRLESQLRQAQKMEAVGRLAGGIAHDFNNLLTVINGYAEFALQEIPSDLALCGSINEILGAGRRAAELTDSLLAFSRKSVRQPTVIKFNDAVRNTAKMLGRVVSEDIQISVQLAEDLWDVEADRGQLEQVLVNLAVNARDAMPQGGILTIETSNVEIDESAGQRLSVAAGQYAMMAVSDTGSGMDADTQAHMFEPFFTTKAPGKGTGLGLATVYGIVKHSGGAVSVYSEVGRGSTFKVLIPRHCKAGEPMSDETPEPPVLVIPRGRRRTILLVEDEEKVRKLTVIMLERHGFRVLEAGNGYQALEICRAEQEAIDLVLSDVVMPQMSGDRLAVELRQLYPSLKVLFMSGYAEHAVVNQALLAPDVQFVSKPFTASTLLNKVNQALNSSGQAFGNGV